MNRDGSMYAAINQGGIRRGTDVTVVVPGPAPEEQVAGETGVEQTSTVETTVVAAQAPDDQSLQPWVDTAAGALPSPRGFTGLALAKRLMHSQYTSQHNKEWTHLKLEPSKKADRTNVEYMMLRTPQAKSSKRMKD